MTNRPTTLPPEIHNRMMENNPTYRERHKKQEAARKKGITPPPLGKTNP